MDNQYYSGLLAAEHFENRAYFPEKHFENRVINTIFTSDNKHFAQNDI